MRIKKRMPKGMSSAGAFVLFIIAAVLITGFYLLITENGALEKSVLELNTQVKTLTTEKSTLEKEKMALEKEKNKALAEAAAKQEENKAMACLLGEIQPKVKQIYDLSREGCYCTQVSPYIANNRDYFGEFNTEILKIVPIVIVSPADVMVWKPGSHKIAWTTNHQDKIKNVKIEYSTNNSESWTTIIDPTPYIDGGYTWTTPDIPGRYILKISSRDNQYIAAREVVIRK